MFKLEVLVNNPLNLDDALALVDAYLEGELDQVRLRHFESLLEKEPLLQEATTDMRRTLHFLKSQPRPAAPAHMAERVRQRLVETGATYQDEPAAVVPFRPRARLRRAAQIAIGLAAAVALFAGLYRSGVFDAAGPSDVEAASLAGETNAKRNLLHAPGLTPSRVAELARRAGVDEVQPLVFAGKRTDMARFILQLRLALADRGGELTGMMPDGYDVRVVVNVDR